MKPDNALPWPQLMEIAIGIMGIAPQDFWSMTPSEWLSALSGWKRKYGIVDAPDANITRNDLQELIRRFPD